jgi:hypothetical protein
MVHLVIVRMKIIHSHRDMGRLTAVIAIAMITSFFFMMYLRYFFRRNGDLNIPRSFRLVFRNHGRLPAFAGRPPK